MIQTSIYALIGILISQKLKNRLYFSTSFILGLMIPDLDVVLDFILSLFFNFNFSYESYINNTLFHSLLLIPFISLGILIYQEIKNKKQYNVVIGITLGFLFHIIFDVISFQPVAIFFPLPLESKLNLNHFISFKVPIYFKNISNLLTIIIFRLYTWKVINLILNQSKKYKRLVKKLTVWMKVQLYLFLIFILLIYFDSSEMINSIFFGVSYTLSFAMTIYMTLKTKKLIN
tara:strand:- start:10721 stop:11413 length:693 start_codon:yes stop_codon:yes gene_type:complete